MITLIKLLWSKKKYMYHLITVKEMENGETAFKGLSAKTEKDLLNKAIKQGLITEIEKRAYKNGAPCLTVVKADTYEKALNTMLEKFNAAGYGNIKLKD